MSKSPSWPLFNNAPHGSRGGPIIKWGNPSSPQAAFPYLSNLATSFWLEAELEIIIDLDLARKCLVKGAQWPLLANKQGRNGDLREKDNNITLNGPR